MLYPDLVLFGAGTRPASAGGRRGRNRRVGQPSRGAGAVGALRKASRGISSLRARQHGRRRSAVVRRQPDTRQRDLELSHGGRRGAVHARAAKPRDADRRPDPRRKPAARRQAPVRKRRNPKRQTGASPDCRRRRRKSQAALKREGRKLAFVRVSRDKRGYEHIYLIDAVTRRGKTSRPRVLYWFRTPPGVTVGREPFDESVRRTLEAQYPDVTFDWEQLRKTAIAPPDVEPWRERRRVERAAKQARQAGDATKRTHPQTSPEVLEVPEVPEVSPTKFGVRNRRHPWNTSRRLEPPEPLERSRTPEPLEPLESPGGTPGTAAIRWKRGVKPSRSKLSPSESRRPRPSSAVGGVAADGAGGSPPDPREARQVRPRRRLGKTSRQVKTARPGTCHNSPS